MLAQESTLVKEALDQSLDYPAYRAAVARQVAEGRTSGLAQSEANVYYTLLNHKRMNRWDKRLVLPSDLKKILASKKHPHIWLVLTESWCGDAAPVLPVMSAFAAESPCLELRISQRDEHPLLMDRFLTDGARSIPKLLVVEPNTYKVIKSWGPRPEEARRRVAEFKALHGSLTMEFRESLQKWYNLDRGGQTIRELARLLALE
jgi:hypothetical protein